MAHPPSLPVHIRPTPTSSVSAPSQGWTFIDALDGAVVVTVPVAEKAQFHEPKTYTKTDSSSNTVTITDGVLFSKVLTANGDMLTIVSDGRFYTATKSAASSGGTLADGDYGDISVSGGGTVITIDTSAVTNAKLQQETDGTVLANISGVLASPSANGISAVLDKLLGTTRGSVIYRGAAAWSALGPGTSGWFLKTLGAGADPVWAAGGGGAAPVPTLATVSFGATPVWDALVDIADGAAGPTSQCIAWPAPTTPEAADEYRWDTLEFSTRCGAGTIHLSVRGDPGPFSGDREIAYILL